ncbi:MAG: hypothetical protein AAF806_21435 [Bacteroidota bacterium]
MRNLLIISVSLVLFALTSCTTEELVAPNFSTQQHAANNTLTMLENDDLVASNSSGNITVQTNIGVVTISTANGEMTVEFNANYDFSNIIPEGTQNLDFEDAQSNVSTLSLDVNSYLGESGRFEAVFDLGANDLSDLELGQTQVIGIEDLTTF